MRVRKKSSVFQLDIMFYGDETCTITMKELEDQRNKKKLLRYVIAIRECGQDKLVCGD